MRPPGCQRARPHDFDPMDGDPEPTPNPSQEGNRHDAAKTPQPNLVAGVKWFLGTYTGRFNRRHKLFGHLLSGRYKALIVDGSRNGYLKALCDYVHLNPARAKLLRVQQLLRAYP